MLNLATSISYGFSGRDVVSLSPVCYSERHGSSFVTRANYSYNGNSSKERVVTLLDYGAGNVRSIRNAIQRLGYHINDVKCPEDISNADTLIFPGVGAFGAAMDFLHKNRLVEALCKYIQEDKPFLGICLGLQLLFSHSMEKGNVEGLGIIPGTVGRFDSSQGLRVPHIGWNRLIVKKSSNLLRGIEEQHLYFVHSYRAIPSDENKEWVLATCNYGGEFIAAIKKGNVHAVQFHPEKSGDAGLGLIQRFLHKSSASVIKEGDEEEKEEVSQNLWKRSMLAKRVIACLDVRANDQGDLVVTKGDQYDVREQTNERGVRNLGKPVDLASRYYEEGADEITFLNITGFRDFPLGDMPMLEVLRRTSEKVFVPLTVGGGIRDFKDRNGVYYSSLDVAAEYFRSGADKISIGSDAVYAAEQFRETGVKSGRSSLEQISEVYGNQAVVVSIDPRRVYVRNPDDVPFKTIKVEKPGPNGEEYAWYQCTVHSSLLSLIFMNFILEVA